MKRLLVLALMMLGMVVEPLLAKEYSANELAGFRKIEGKMAVEESKKCAVRENLKSDYFKVGEVTVNYLYEEKDSNKKKLVEAITEAIKKIQAAGFALPTTIDFVLSAQPMVRNVAFTGDESGNRKTTVFLGPKIFQVNDGKAGPKGVADALSASKKPVAVIVHELGHVAHELRDEHAFWTLKDPLAQPAPPDAAAKISDYARTNQLEFVAETFTGYIMGEKYPQAAIDGYTSLGGPTSEKFLALVQKQTKK